VRERGGSVRFLPFLAGRSTTAILRRAAVSGAGSGSSGGRRERGRSPSAS
jgi:hypothetical protein